MSDEDMISLRGDEGMGGFLASLESATDGRFQLEVDLIVPFLRFTQADTGFCST